MTSPRVLPPVLFASLLLAGCRTADPVPDSWIPPSAEAGELPESRGPSTWAGPAAYGEPEEPPEAGEKVGRVTLGAWGFDGRLQGEAAGAPAEYGMDVSAIPGFSLEARFHSLKKEDSWTTAGLLFEHFRSSADEAVAGGTARTEGALTGAWFVMGFAGRPYRDGDRPSADFGHRFDFMVGLRRGSVKAEVPDGSGGSYRKSQTWGELAFGLRAEVSPVRRVFLFVRGDVGSVDNLRFHSDEEETQGDSAVGSVTTQFMAGLRIRPVDHLSLVAGWRYLRLDGKEFINDGTEDVETARATWSGPWAGLEVDF